MNIVVRQSIDLLFQNRYSSDHSAGGLSIASQTEVEDGMEEGLQTLERTAWLRWLWFVLATLPPTIKLMAMSGVIWPQIWGIMFFASWIVNESMIIFAAINSKFYTISRSSEISWPGYEATRQSAKWQYVEQRLDD